MVDVPLHIINPPSIQRNVQVTGGANWDLSRSAVQTPVVRLPDPEPVEIARPYAEVVTFNAEQSSSLQDALPRTKPTVVHFAKAATSLPKAKHKQLAALNKKTTYVVVGHAAAAEDSPSHLAWERARNVARFLTKTGHKVSAIKAFGADRLMNADNDSMNSRVEVYAAGRGN